MIGLIKTARQVLNASGGQQCYDKLQQKGKTLHFHAGIKKHKLTNVTLKVKMKHTSLSLKSGLSREGAWEQQGPAGNSVRMCAEASGPTYLLPLPLLSYPSLI